MEVEIVQSGIQNLTIGSLPLVNSRVKIKRSFEKKAILKQKLRDAQKQKLR
jgi:hypothetical protein